jgi:hypothetical protein
MPRRPQVRGPLDGVATPPGDDARHAWLSRWKEFAIGRLAASATAATRSQVRLEVERALARLGSRDSENEIRDVVEATLDQILQDLANRDADTARARQKAEHLEQVENYLGIALLQASGPRTAAMLRRPEFAKPVLTERLRRRLRHTLTGGESDQEVLEHAIVFVSRCLAKQPPLPRQWGRRLATGTLATTVVAAKMLEQSPELREALNKRIAAGHEKLGALLARFAATRKPTGS